MGKNRLAKVREKFGRGEVTMEERKERSLKERLSSPKFLAKAKRQLHERMEEGYDENVAKARASCLDRWRGMTGKGPDENPD